MRDLESWGSEMLIYVAGHAYALQATLGACEMLRKIGKIQTKMNYQSQTGGEQIETSTKSKSITQNSKYLCELLENSENAYLTF